MKVCLSSRLPRDSPANGDGDSTFDSSDENLDEMAVTIQKYLGQKDAEDVKKIVSDINSAKGPEESVDGYVRLDTTFRIRFHPWNTIAFIKALLICR